MKRLTIKSSKWGIFAVFTALLVSAVFLLLPVEEVSAGTVNKTWIGTSNVEVYANNQSDKIADVNLKVSMECYTHYTEPDSSLYVFYIECIITPNVNKGSDIFRVDKVKFTPHIITNNSFSYNSYSSCLSDSYATLNIMFKMCEFPGITVTSTFMSTNSIVKSGESFAMSGPGVKDQPVTVGFIAAYTTTSALPSSIYFDLEGLEITGLAFAPNYEADNDEKIRVAFNCGRENSFGNIAMITGTNNSDRLKEISYNFQAVQRF